MSHSDLLHDLSYLPTYLHTYICTSYAFYRLNTSQILYISYATGIPLYHMYIPVCTHILYIVFFGTIYIVWQ